LTRSFGRVLIFAFAATAFVTVPATAYAAGPASGAPVVLPDDVTPDAESMTYIRTADYAT
jgi:hypothetical protein